MARRRQKRAFVGRNHATFAGDGQFSIVLVILAIVCLSTGTVRSLEAQGFHPASVRVQDAASGDVSAMSPGRVTAGTNNEVLAGLPFITVHASFSVAGDGHFLFREDLAIARDGTSTENLVGFARDEPGAAWFQNSSSATGSPLDHDFMAFVNAVQVDHAISQPGNCTVTALDSTGQDQGIVGTYEIHWYAFRGTRENDFKVSLAGPDHKAPSLSGRGGGFSQSDRNVCAAGWT
jgi:hypothetical protein